MEAQPTATPTSNIFRPFLDRARLEPARPFMHFINAGESTTISHRVMLQQAAAVVGALLAEGIKPGGIVCIVLEHSPILYASFIGCVLNGFVPTILPPPTPKQDPLLHRRGMKVLFSRIQPAAVVTSPATEAAVPEGAYAGIDTSNLASADIAQADPQDAWETNVSRDVLAFLQHSSGTTGHKKGVMLTHAQVLTQLEVYAEAIGLSEDDPIVSWLPLYHDMGLITSFLLPAVIGCPLVSIDAVEWVMRPGMFLDAIERFRGAFAWLPNFAFHHLCRSEPPSKVRNLSSIRAIVNCSEPCRVGALEVFASKFGSAGLRPDALKVSYAMAENVFAVTQTPVGIAARPGRGAKTQGYLSCGAALPDAEIRIVGPDGAPVPVGEIGEIWVRTSCLFDGYFRMPELTQQKLVDGWYRTGDLGCLEEGELFVVGRLDDMLIVNGRNLIAHEIEEIVSTVSGVAPGRVIACGEHDEAGGLTRLIIIAELQAEADARATSPRIRNAVFSTCGVSPSAVRFVPRGFLVKSSSGKLARAQSYEKLRQGEIAQQAPAQ